MTEEQEKTLGEGDKKKKKKKQEDGLEFCTTAPSAEHARATNEDEPCDDGREGE